MPYFTHLHVHSHYSILDGMSKIPDLIKKCKANGMYAMALTDHGNMFGIKDLVDTVKKENGKVKDKIKEQEAILQNDGSSAEEKREAEAMLDLLKGQLFKPIIGIEAYCARRTLYQKDKSITELNPDNGRPRIVDRSGWHLILLAKNKTGYKNLCKLSSIAYTDGFYDRPRIDHDVLQQYHDGIICCSACLGGEVPQKILANDLQGAEQSVLWFKQLFGDDYYLELQRHKTDKPNAATDTYEKQQRVNPVLVELARKHNIKLIATNDVHFVEEAHGEAHDHLICISTQSDVNDPNRMHYTKQEWLKSPDEMAAIFADLPEALENTREIADKVETYSIDSDPLMPMFDIPESFGTEEQWRQRYTEEDLFNEFTQNEKHQVVMPREKAEEKIKKLGGYEKLYRIKFEADYLEKLVWEGAKERYGDSLTDEQRERILFELHTIKTMGFPGYFLIVSDYIRAAREELDVSVGPGRGSAAGSVVAYCLKITDVDPLKYDLLFERFLNPDRISLPDIDVDFDDAGRAKVLDWITKKYGKEKVAHIITYGTMATKSSIADVGRVEKVPLDVVNRIKSFIPDKFPEGMKDESGKPLAAPPKVNLRNCYKYVPELRAIMQSSRPEDQGLKSMLEYAEELEDTNRQIGIHACGVIIGADDLTKFAPVCTIKDKESGQDVVVTQYDGHVVENVGLIKMDFLGLKNLTIIKDALANIKHSHGIDIDIDHIPIDDEKTYKLFSEGNTVGTFQFESPGMQKYLRELEPHVFEDLIAMNALYRPGPMDYIPDFIDRKQGRKPITYDIPCMEQYLKDTYGITVYQEQVMLLSRQLAGFTRGQSDTLRKAMGKKQIDKMNELEQLFYEGGERNGHPKDKLHKIWEDWKKFAAYAFNKSHATCYAWVSYQTAWIKAHYPSEFQASNLTQNISNMDEMKEIMADCRKAGIKVLSPDVNESDAQFSVNKNGDIRFGLGGLKGFGENIVDAIIRERTEHGPFTDLFNFVERMAEMINRRGFETLVYSGAFDSFGYKRSQFFLPCKNGELFIDEVVKYATLYRNDQLDSANSLFGEVEELKPVRPEIPTFSGEEDVLSLLQQEKEFVGMYLSSHPLDRYRFEIETFTDCRLTRLQEHIDECESADKAGKASLAGIVTDVKTLTTRSGTPGARVTVEDFDGTYEFALFGKDYETWLPFMQPHAQIFIEGEITPRYFVKPEERAQGKKAPYNFKIKKISLLGNLNDSLLTGFNIILESDWISPDFRASLVKILKAHKGKTPLSLYLHDKATGYNLEFQSKKFAVGVSEAFISAIQKLGVQYSVSHK